MMHRKTGKFKNHSTIILTLLRGKCGLLSFILLIWLYSYKGKKQERENSKAITLI